MPRWDAALKFVIPTGVFMGRQPTQRDEKRLSCSNCSLWTRYSPLCHPERSREPALSEVEQGPAVQRTFRGNVFRQSAPGFPATRPSATATCAAFSKEGRMKPANATNIDRKSGVAEWRDLRFHFRQK